MNLVAIAATRLLNVLAPSSVKEKINRHGRTKIMSLVAERGNHATALHRHAASIHDYGRHRAELVNGAAYLMAQTTYIRPERNQLLHAASRPVWLAAADLGGGQE